MKILVFQILFWTWDNIEIPDRCITTDSNFINSMYGHLIRNHLYDEMSSSVILAARNFDVNEINKAVVSLLDSYNERVLIYEC